MILKQQRQTTAGTIHKNRNAPGTADDSLFSLGHKSPKPLMGNKGSISVQITRTALLQMMMLVPPLRLTRGHPCIRLSKVLAGVKRVCTKLLSHRAICWHSEADSQDHLPQLQVVNQLAKQSPFTENPPSERVQKFAR